MFKHIIQLGLLVLVLLMPSLAEAASYNKKDANEIRRIMRKAGIDSIQESLLIRRMAARKVPARLAIDWSDKMLQMKQHDLPVQIAVDRLQQGLIKNIKLGYINKALNVLLNNLAWSNELIVNKALQSPEQVSELDEDEQSLLKGATVNLEIAARQGYRRNELSVLMSRKGVDLEMAAELARTLTVWTNYGVPNKRVLLSLKRSSRVGLSADKLQDLREAVDSKVVVEHLSKPRDIAKTIWHEIRQLAEIMDAEHAFRSRMQHNPHSLKGTGDDSGSQDDLNISDVNVMDGSSTDNGADIDGGGVGEIDSGAAGGDVGGGGDEMGGGDAGSSDSGSGDAGSGMDGGMGGDGMGDGGMMGGN